MGAFSGQTAIITGATGGIGQAIADRLVAAGASVILVARARSALDQLVRENRWDPNAVRCHPVDLAIEAEIREFATEVDAAHRQLHLLVHAAGTIALGGVDESRLADFDTQYQVNVRAPYQLTQALLPHLLRCGGQVVFLNSSAGIQARRGIAQYAATKYALRAVADSLRDEVNERGVRVLSVFLGRTATRMQQSVHAHEQRPYQAERLLQPADVAAIVVSALVLPRTAEVTDLHIRPMLKS
jgi:NADP-dependent 3-hydroxy acid dehydrogenase YdfG